ncbi:MAG: FAD-binding protein [Clostridiales bacterium]|nr:FAD-binding protein [Clostridiales bacterium]
MQTVTTDCLIIGGGLAGRMAAREASRTGLQVTLLSDGPGASPWVHGINIPVHPKDSVESFLSDTIASGQGVSDPALAAALCQDAPEILTELEGMGLRFNRDGQGYQFLRPLGASHPRVMSVGNDTGVAVLKTLKAELEAKLDERPGLRAVHLQAQGGRVTGALCFDQPSHAWVTVRAAATVLACGGFCGIYPFTTNKRDSGGDGVAMAFRAGAALCDLEMIQFEPSGAVWPEALRGTSMITTMFFEGAVLRNSDGERFMLRYGPEGERVNKDLLARRIAAEIQADKGTAHGGVYFDATALGKERLEALYPAYVARYRAVGIDLASEWIELAPCAHTSLGGVRVDAQGASTVEGLFACGEVMGGLHGANRIGGSAGLETLVFGRRAGRAAAAYIRQNPAGADIGRMDSPASAANTSEFKPEMNAFPFPDSGLVFSTGNGNASSNSRQTTVVADHPARTPATPESLTADFSVALHALRTEMQTTLDRNANVLRNRDGLASALRTLRGGWEALLRLRPAEPHETFLWFRLHNDLTAACLLCTAALVREDSVGCHCRTDAQEAPAVPYRVQLSRNGDGSIQAERLPVGR